METKNFTNFTKKYNCKQCNISCSRNTEWQRHLATSKHKKMSIGNLMEDKNITMKDKRSSLIMKKTLLRQVLQKEDA